MSSVETAGLGAARRSWSRGIPSGVPRRSTARASSGWRAATLIALRTRIYFEWVPSEANMADLPTRPEKFGDIPVSAEWRTHITLPPGDVLIGSTSGWLATIDNLIKAAHHAARWHSRAHA